MFIRIVLSDRKTIQNTIIGQYKLCLQYPLEVSFGVYSMLPLMPKNVCDAQNDAGDAQNDGQSW